MCYSSHQLPQFFDTVFVPGHCQKLFHHKNLHCYIIVHICSFGTQCFTACHRSFITWTYDKRCISGAYENASLLVLWQHERALSNKTFGSSSSPLLKVLLGAALALITWVSGPQDLDPAPFFPRNPQSLAIFMRDLNGTWKDLKHTEHTQSGDNAWWETLKLF